jgi:parallel beta-helix repeat protein
MIAFLCALAFAVTEDAKIVEKIKAGTGTIELPAGVVDLSRGIELPEGSHDLTIRGAKAGTILRAAPNFEGRALLGARGGRNLRFEGFSIEGSRAAVGKPQALGPSDVPFAKWTRNNGILLEGVTGATVTAVTMSEIAGFAVLVTASTDVHIERVTVKDSGSLNPKGRNNSTGGILLEQGTTDFEVLHCEIHNVSGNGIWTHSLYKTKRNARGRIADNTVTDVARDAIQVGHATEITVEDNTGEKIGYPVKLVDAEGGGVPVGLDTAGDTDKSMYRNNHFSEINGKCIDLDGFHDGEVRGNICENHDVAASYPFGNYGIIMNNSNPDMQSRNVVITENTIDGTLYGGIFVIGTGNRVTKNKLSNLNMAHCPAGASRFGCFLGKDEPDILRTGIYLGKGADRPDPARANLIEDNEISGYEMGRHCIHVAPGVSLDRNTIRRNNCSDDTTVNARNSMHQLPVRRLGGVIEEQ